MEGIVRLRVPYCVLRGETANRSAAARQSVAFCFRDGQMVNISCSFVFSRVQGFGNRCGASFQGLAQKRFDSVFKLESGKQPRFSGRKPPALAGTGRCRYVRSFIHAKLPSRRGKELSNNFCNQTAGCILRACCPNRKAKKCHVGKTSRLRTYEQNLEFRSAAAGRGTDPAALRGTSSVLRIIRPR
jgi:hypothetical protein